MDTKQGKMVAHRPRRPPIDSHNSFNMCSREVTGQIKNIYPPSMRWLCKLTSQVKYITLHTEDP